MTRFKVNNVNETTEQMEISGDNTHSEAEQNEAAAPQVIPQEKTPSTSQGLSPQQQKLRNLIREWAYTDSQKEPKKFKRLFYKIYFPGSNERY